MSDVLIKNMRRGKIMQEKEKRLLYGLERLRGYINFNEDGPFILGLITLQYLEGQPEKYSIPDDAKWSMFTTSNYIPHNEQVFEIAFHSIEHENPSLEGVFTSLRVPKLDYQKISLLIEFINSISRINNDVALTFEIFLNAFLSHSQEIQTPKGLSKLMVRLLDVQGGDIYDGTCGTGQLLIEAGKQAELKKNDFKLWGQEIDQNIYMLSIMNMIVHNMPFELKYGDVLSRPLFLSDSGLKKFNYIVMDSPISLPWMHIIPSEIEFDTYNRFKYGVPSKSKSGWLFIQHALASLKETGKAALSTTLSLLSSGGTDKKIRENLLKEDILESITILPSGTLNRVTTPVAILIFNMQKSEDRKGKIEFINATDYFQKEKRKSILTEDNIDTIVSAYNDKKDIKNFTKIINLEDIEDANLSYANYFDYNEVDSLFGKVEVDKRTYENSFDSYIQLKEIGNLFRGIPGKSEDRRGYPTDYYLIQVSDIKEGKINVDNLSPIDVDSERAANFLVTEGDLLISNRGVSIKIAVVPENKKKLLLSQNLIGFRANNETNPYFVKAFLESPVGMSYLASSQTGSTATALNVKDLETIKIPDFPSDEQNEIGWIIKKADTDLQEALQKAKNEYVEKYKGIYQHMRLTEAFNLIEE